MSVKFFARDLGPEMAAPILWAPGIFGLSLQEKNSMPMKFLVLAGGILGFRPGGGGSANFFKNGQ